MELAEERMIARENSEMTPAGRESWTVAGADVETTSQTSHEGALFYTETAATKRLRSALKKDMYGGSSDDGSTASLHSLLKESVFADPEPRVYGLVDPATHDGFIARSARAQQFVDCEREMFPHVGDEVEIHHAQLWRKATIKAIKPTRWFRNRPSKLLYDCELVCDGNWLRDAARQGLRVFQRRVGERSDRARETKPIQRDGVRGRPREMTLERGPSLRERDDERPPSGPRARSSPRRSLDPRGDAR